MLEGLPAAEAGSTKGVCPECGRGFDRAEPATFHSPASPSALARVLPRAIPFLAEVSPGRWVCLAYAAIWGVLLVIWSGPGGWMTDTEVRGFSLVMTATIVGWCGTLLLQLCARAALWLSERSVGRWRWRWLAIPVTLATAYLAQTSGVVWQLRWWHARPEFEAMRAQLNRGPAPPTPRWVGTFYVTAIEDGPGNDSAGNVVYWLGGPDGSSDSAAAIIDARKCGTTQWPFDRSVWGTAAQPGKGWYVGMDRYPY